MKKLFACLALAAIMVSAVPRAVFAQSTSAAQRYIVAFSEGTSLAQGSSQITAAGGGVIQTLQYSHAVVATLDSVTAYILSQSDNVRWVELDVRITPDGRWSWSPWSMLATGAASQGGPIKLFIIDSGASPNISYDSKSAVSTGMSPMAGNTHGITVANAVVQTATSMGIRNNISINSISDRSFSSDPTVDVIYISNTAEAVQQAVSQGAQVINVSSSLRSATTPQIWKEAADAAQAAGAVIVVSAGNSGDTKPLNVLTSHPAVVSVGALDSTGNVASYSDGVRDPSRADFFANGTTDGEEGTSYAAPKVAVYVASILKKPIPASADTNGNGKWDYDEIKAELARGIQTNTFPIKEGARNSAVSTTPTPVVDTTPITVTMPPVTVTAEPLPPEVQPTGPTSAGLVSCGVSTYRGVFDVSYYLAATSCNFCYLAQLAQNVVNFLVMITIPLSIMMFAWAGIAFFTSAGNPKKISHAKKIFSSVFIGFVIAITGWLVVQVVLQTIVNPDFFNATNWTNLQCEDLNNRLDANGQPLRSRNISVSSLLSLMSVMPTNPIAPPVPSTNNNTVVTTNSNVQSSLAQYNSLYPNNKIMASSNVSFEGVNVGLVQAVMNDVSGAGSSVGGVTITSANDGVHASGSLHSSGSAFDVVPANNAQFLQYMQSSSNFTSVVNQVAPGKPAFQDRNGVIWSYEPSGSNVNNTGNHWHVSTTGR